MRKLLITVMALAMLVPAGSAFAGAKIKIDDNASFDLGYRIQALGIASQEDLDGDDEFDSVREWKVRRARFRLGAKIGEHVTGFLQTDAAADKTVMMIDAWLNFKADPWLQFFVGRHMAPASRQNLTSSGALMAIDRPGMAYKSLTWGGRALHTFSNRTYGAGDSGLRSPDGVRDLGLTVFGSNDVGEQGHFKYYAGVYNGIQGGVDDKDRVALRAQYNLWDAEPGYFNSSTYLGKKKTLGIGVSYDMQAEVATNSETDKPLADYSYMSADVFLDYPLEGGNALTLEGGWMMLDFDDAADFMHTQGSGFYGQAGYYLASGWQPWVEFETYSSDADGDVGSYSNFRVGLTWYLEGHHANIKAGYESFTTDAPIVGDEDAINSFVLGFYTTY